MEFWREEFASIDRFLEIRSSPSVKTVPSPSSDLKRGEGGNIEEQFTKRFRILLSSIAFSKLVVERAASRTVRSPFVLIKADS